MAKPEEMWQCKMSNCGFIYSADRGDKKGKIPPGTPFKALPAEWKCPCCGASAKMFRTLGGSGAAEPAKEECEA